MTIRFDRVGSCPNPVTMLIECYSPKDGLAHGSLDVTVRACADCHEGVRTAVWDCGMTPHSFTPVASHQGRPSGLAPVLCGDRTVFAENAYTGG